MFKQLKILNKMIMKMMKVLFFKMNKIMFHFKLILKKMGLRKKENQCFKILRKIAKIVSEQVNNLRCHLEKVFVLTIKNKICINKM